ncbi:Ger(x)C family spore germination protein [Sporolactobacillus sp. THM7-7]|nr:Ger(x)C family spore germination protein [Sporolactobacillus sp. THM7-7]
MKRKAAAALLMAVSLAGCVPTNIIDDILMVEAEGYDYLGNGRVYGTVTMPNYVAGGAQGAGGGGVPTTAAMMWLAEGATYDGKSLVDKFQSKGQRPLRVGKLRVMLFDKEYAKHGLKKQIEFRNRDPDTARDLYLAVVDGSANKLLSGKYQTAIPISRYVSDMIDQNQNQNYPTNDAHDVFFSYYGNYMDPFMPMIKKRGKHLEMQGLALFKKDKYALSIPERDAFVFKMLYEPFNQGVYDYEFMPRKHVALRNVNARVQYRVRNGNGAEPDIKAKVSIEGQVRQAAPGTIGEVPIEEIEDGMEKELEQKAAEMVGKFQKKSIDPLRLGDRVRSFTRRFDGDTWQDRYPNAHFHCSVQIDINQTGISR